MSKKKNKKYTTPPQKQTQTKEKKDMGAPAYGSINRYEPCHSGIIHVMDIGDTQVWAGKYADMKYDLDWDLRIRLNDGFTSRQPGLITADPAAMALLPKEVTEVRYPPTIDIDWEDFGAPPLDREWWEALVRAIGDLGGGSVSVYCYGGHGRTGTALSILAGLSGACPEGQDPVAWVRKEYCAEAVESYEQRDYVAEITGRDIKSLPTSAYKYLNSTKPSGGAATGQQSFPNWRKNSYGVWETSWDEVAVDGWGAGTISKDTTMFDEGYAVQASAAAENAAKVGGK